MELYQAYTDYDGMMELDRDHVPLPYAEKVCGSATVVNYNGIEIDLGKAV